MTRGMVLVALGLALAAPGAAAPGAGADGCGVPEGVTPLWVDFAGHDAPVPVGPGRVLAVSSGTEVPARMRAAGAGTAFFDLNFNRRVGTPTKPADPASIPARAKSSYDYAVAATGCAAPYVALNELFGAQTPTPWTPGNAQYRANVLAYVQELARLGARPLLSIANPPYADGEAAEWWRQVSRSAILLRQVYFTAPNATGLWKLGPVAASRSMRTSLRTLVSRLARIGIPSQRIALQFQFNSGPGLGPRAGLQPREAWLEIVKLEALAAKQVARELDLAAVWSWGWAHFPPGPDPDPDKPAAACVWLWARDQSLCDGPGAAGPGFDASLTEGQLVVPAGARCVLPGGGTVDRKPLKRLTALTGDLGYAASVLFEQAVLAAEQPVDPADVASAERAVVAGAFGGDRRRYRAALAAAGLTLGDGRAILAARLRRDAVEARFRPPRPTAAQVQEFLARYAAVAVRPVATTEPAAWLGGGRRGFAVSTLAPEGVFRLERAGEIDTVNGRIGVEPLGPALPLALVPRPQAEATARAALARLARESLYRAWLRRTQTTALAETICTGDRMPAPAVTDLSPFVPFLLPS